MFLSGRLKIDAVLRPPISIGLLCYTYSCVSDLFSIGFQCRRHRIEFTSRAASFPIRLLRIRRTFLTGCQNLLGLIHFRMGPVSEVSAIELKRLSVVEVKWFTSQGFRDPVLMFLSKISRPSVV